MTPVTDAPQIAMNDLSLQIKQPVSPEEIATMLRQGRCPPDRAFDWYLPPDLQVISSTFWTPLLVAIRAAGWLEELGIASVVDIGSGAGKFCVATALAGRARFVGLEQREHLVEAARSLARTLCVEGRVYFRHSVFGETELPVADAYYLYNPFGENTFGEEEHLDETVELSPQRYVRDVEATEGLLDAVPLGTHVLTYNGFGGRFPVGFRLIREDMTLPCPLRMWKKIDP